MKVLPFYEKLAFSSSRRYTTFLTQWFSSKTTQFFKNTVLTKSLARICRQEKEQQQCVSTGEKGMEISNCKTRNRKHYNENSHSNMTKPASCLGFAFGLFL